ncbi:hypothetical protein MEA186_03244 [Mesorhizobium amorphae CCNWGS0123]|uniref:Uncharacterized protein n=1 Tax=Mesorhizobium amorphae CCNWGS0123 TaxID=1082933 RepID=G6Y3Z6_9HYPH|nr:hypothetical protein MEA186_03244 [Mesorhizobium amorphae CCNWGS0123]
MSMSASTTYHFHRHHARPTALGAVAFLKPVAAYYASLGVTVSRVMTDNVLRAEGNGETVKVSLFVSMLSPHNALATVALYLNAGAEM